MSSRDGQILEIIKVCRAVNCTENWTIRDCLLFIISKFVHMQEGILLVQYSFLNGLEIRMSRVLEWPFLSVSFDRQSGCNFYSLLPKHKPNRFFSFIVKTYWIMNKRRSNQSGTQGSSGVDFSCIPFTNKIQANFKTRHECCFKLFKYCHCYKLCFHGYVYYLNGVCVCSL